MKKPIRVLIAGVPTVGLPEQAWREKMTFKIRGKAPRVPMSKRFESFRPNLTNGLRKEVAKALSNSVELLRRDVVVEITDAGEFYFDAPKRFEGSYGLDEESMVDVAMEFREAATGFDLAILLGGDHAGGVLLYALDGKVCRFDQHSDSCEAPLECPRGQVTRNGYVCTAVRCGLKKIENIVGVGVREGAAAYGITPNCSDAKIIDVDVDAFAVTHGIKSEFNKGVLSPQDVIGTIRKCKPNALGIFEIVEGDGKAVELAIKLAEEAVIARAK